jgi:hypothetical protein
MSEESVIIDQENDRTFLEALASPDPDPETLPALRSPADLALQAETCGHLLRAALRQVETVEALKSKRDADVAAWNAMIATAQDRATTWRAMVLAWMQRTETKQIKSPWFTASVTKGRTKKVILNEAEAIKTCLAVYPKAVEMRPHIIKAELDVAVDSLPKHFVGIVEEVTSEPSLTIRKAG